MTDLSNAASTGSAPDALLPPVVRSVHVRRSQQDAFAVFTERIGDWWPLQLHGIYQADTAGVWFEGERVVERSTAGEESVWADVVSWSPPERLVLLWYPGGTPEDGTLVEVTFTPDEDGTRVVLSHSGWEVLGDEAAQGRAAYAGGWVAVVEEYQRIAEGGA
jgi:uncharacterized protein YndB with AHSA1/START domain